MSHRDMPSIELGVMVHESTWNPRHERREPGREDEDPLVVAMGCGCLKPNGTKDDDDDADDEVAQNKLLILVAKDVKTEPVLQPDCEEKGVNEHTTSWMVSLLRLLGYRRATLQSGWRVIGRSHQNCEFVELVFA